ncbi:WG repeat-containing protein [Bacillus sp. ISL-41]|uniref:WG repeat-containing protein n=1 Tax=Bacillus sp. ISL-41 TaxID=2819127 RepID=UPI001BE75F23|nr:WG repeat-containing protein [Bacillus sp. ISL-41]MBT2644687.1 WG repeat-containing protein [Bacillus sp. ISL-41]
MRNKGFIILLTTILFMNLFFMNYSTNSVSASGAVSTAANLPSGIKPQYTYALHFQEGLAWVQNEDGWGAIDTTGNWVIPPIAGNLKDDLYTSFQEGISWLEFTDGFRPINKQGKFITNKKYMNHEPFDEGLAAVCDFNGKWGFIDKTGKEVIKPKYNEVGEFINGIAMIRITQSYGLINKEGKEIVKPQYEEIASFQEGLAKVSKNGKSGFIDQTGKVVIPLKYDSADSFKNGYARVGLNYKSYYIDNNGNITEKYVDGVTIFSQNHLYGLKNRSGKVLLKPMYDWIGDFNEGIAVTTLFVNGNRLNGLIDNKGKIIVKPQYSEVYNFQEGLAVVKSPQNKYGVINKAGKNIVSPQYNFISDFKNGFAMVEKNNKYGLINMTGKIIVNPQYSFIDEFHEGLAKVSKNGMDGFIDKSGKEVIKPQYVSHTMIPGPLRAITGAGYSSDGLIRVFVDGEFGYIANPLSVGEQQYIDFRKGEYWSEDMVWAIENKLISGYIHNGVKSLKPDDKLTEAQAITVLYRYFEPKAMGTTTPKINWWASVPYQLAEQDGLNVVGSIKNQSGSNEITTRGKLAELLASKHFGRNVSEKEAVNFMYQANISSGYADKNGQIPKTYESYGADKTLLRAHIAAFIKRYNDYIQSK